MRIYDHSVLLRIILIIIKRRRLKVVKSIIQLVMHKGLEFVLTIEYFLSSDPQGTFNEKGGLIHNNVSKWLH